MKIFGIIWSWELPECKLVRVELFRVQNQAQPKRPGVDVHLGLIYAGISRKGKRTEANQMRAVDICVFDDGPS